jgi:bacillopeptidase F (M6 metalloprotease family)
LTEAQCREQDEGLGHAIANHRRLDAPNTGDVKVLVLLCRFRDHVGAKLPSREHFEELFNGNGPSDLNPVGSIKEWLYYNSVGKYRVTFDVQDWFTLPHNEAYYAGGVSGLQGPAKMQEVFAPKLDDLYKSGYDFRTLDSKGWGVLDHLVAIHRSVGGFVAGHRIVSLTRLLVACSGYGAELGDPNKPELAGCVPPATDRIWSQGIGFTAGGWNSIDFAYTVSPFILAGAYDPVVCDNKPANMGVIAHEYMHGFGLIDVYDQDKDEAPIFIGGLGRFCSMSALYGWNRNLKFPGHLSPFSRGG